MKISPFEILQSGKTSWGLVFADRFYPVADNLDEINTPLIFLDALRRWDYWSVKLKSINEVIKINPDQYQFLRKEEIRYLSPVTNPPTFRDFYAFEQHVKTARSQRNLEMIPEWYEFPVFYFSNPYSFLGHGKDLQKPKYTKELDFELEIACIIGKSGKDIPVEEAEQYIAGYSILNDWSARDVQRREMKVGLGPAKGKDFATGLGPYMVTPDELDHLRKNKSYDMAMKAFKNGIEISSGNFSDISFSFAEMIARASQGVYLNPGDIIGSGTVGTGCILELKAENTNGWLKAGDTVRLEIDHLGILENKII